MNRIDILDNLYFQLECKMMDLARDILSENGGRADKKEGRRPVRAYFTINGCEMPEIMYVRLDGQSVYGGLMDYDHEVSDHYLGTNIREVLNFLNENGYDN